MTYLPGLSPTYPADFNEWWDAYPRRVGKVDAFKAWRQTAVIRPPQQALIRITLVHAGHWKRQGKDPEKLPYPATWLRAERWNDEILYREQVGFGEKGEPVYEFKTWAPDYIILEEEDPPHA